MLKREMKVNCKSFWVWTGILCVLFFVVFLIYPSIVNDENMALMDEMMKMFPQELLKAFNMDINSLESVFGWLKSEGFVFLLLIIGAYAGILGSNILLKEESDKTIEYLNSLPVTRKKIVCTKYVSGMIYIFLMVVVIGVFNAIGLVLSEDFDHKQFLLLSITPFFSSSAIYSLCMFLSTFTHKTKKMLGISLAIVFGSYLLQVLSSLGSNVEFLKYFSLFTLADVRGVITEGILNPVIIITSIGISVVLFLLTLIRYERKELL